MAINLAQIRDELRPGLYAVDGQYKNIPAQYKKVFKTKQSTMEVERKAQMAFMGMAQLKQEGGATQFDNNAGQRFIFNAATFEVGLGYSITRKAIRDNLYKSEFQPTNLNLTKSDCVASEILTRVRNQSGCPDTNFQVSTVAALVAPDH